MARRAAKSHVLVMLGSLAAGVATAVTLLDSWQKVLVDVGLKKNDTFVMAEQTARGELARQLVHMVSQRDFWVVRYAGSVDAGYPREDQDDAWRHYNDSVVVWNESYMTNAMLAGRYFGSKAEALLADINWRLRGLNTCLNRIHYGDVYKDADAVCHVDGVDGGNQKQNLAAVNKATADLDLKVKDFVAALPNSL